MSSVRELTRLMRDLEDPLVVCIRRGMCRAVRPLFEQTGREADVTRGKLALPDGLMKEMFDDPKGVGGSFNLRHCGVSSRIGPKKRGHIAAEPGAVAAGCPACMSQISDMQARAGDRVAVKHPVELYAESLP